MIRSLLLSLAIAGGWFHSGSQTPAGGGRALAPLPCDASTACDMHFVADDFSGTAGADWSSRDTAVTWVGVHTAASPTKQASQFPGRAELAAFSATAYFALAANGAHAVTGAVTYEMIVKVPGTGNYQFLTAAGGAFNTPGAQQWYLNTGTTQILMGITDNAGSQVNANGPGLTTGRYVWVSSTIAAGSGNIKHYLNGAAAGSTATAGTFFTGGALAFYIGSLNGTLPWGGTVVEFLRHRIDLSPTQVSNRYAASPFDTLKGY